MRIIPWELNRLEKERTSTMANDANLRDVYTRLRRGQQHYLHCATRRLRRLTPCNDRFLVRTVPGCYAGT